jgi:hypothetical protein
LDIIGLIAGSKENSEPKQDFEELTKSEDSGESLHQSGRKLSL